MAVQSKQSISRGQARAIVDRKKPNFRNMNYATAVKANAGIGEGNLERVTSPTVSSGTGQEAKGEVVVAEEVEVVCMSPSSGTLFTRTVNLTAEAKGNVEVEDRTSKDSAIVRAEGREIFDEMTKEIPEKGTVEENDDREQYEAELEKARRMEKRGREENREERRERPGRSKLVEERKRHRSKTRRSRSNSADRRRKQSRHR